MFNWLKNIKCNQYPKAVNNAERKLGKSPVFPIAKLLSDNYALHAPAEKAVYKKPYYNLADAHAPECYTR